MSFLFYCNSDQTACLHPEVIKLCPPLSILKESELLYVILFVDYSSPYKQHPEHERKRRAMMHAFGDNAYDIIESDRIAIAIRHYESLQYNPKVAIIRQFQSKIDSLLLAMQEDTSPTNIKKNIETISLLRKEMEVYQNDYDSEVQKRGVLKGKMSLSLIEELKSNQKLWNSVVEKR